MGSCSPPVLHEVAVWTIVLSLSLLPHCSQLLEGRFSVVDAEVVQRGQMIVLVSLLEFSFSNEYLTDIGSLLVEPGVSLQFPRESRRSGLNMRASAAVAMNAFMLLPDTSSAALSLRLSGCSWRVARRKVCNCV